MTNEKIMRRTLYGRRKGQTLRKSLSVKYDELLPHYEFFPSDVESLCAQHLRVWLEVGFGGGEHLLHQALLHPDVMFIGCEPFMNGVAKFLRDLQENNVQNVRIFEGDARDILAVLPDQKLEKVFVLYPDPWPKHKHIKRRFFQTPVLNLLAQKMQSGAHLRLATDINDYGATSLAHISKSEFFVWSAMHPKEWLSPWSDWVSTRYEQKAFREGREPMYLSFIRK